MLLDLDVGASIKRKRPLMAWLCEFSCQVSKVKILYTKIPYPITSTEKSLTLFCLEIHSKRALVFVR